MRIRKGESIRLVLASSVATQVFAAARILYDNGQTDDLEVTEKTTGSARAIETFNSELVARADGEVTNAIVSVRTTRTRRGQLFAKLYVAIGGTLYGALCRGYVYDGHDLSLWEFGEPGPGHGEGFRRAIALTNPAANAEIVATADENIVPTNAIWRVLSLTVSIGQGITDTPRPAMVYQTATGATILGRSVMATDVPVSSTVRATWTRGVDSESNVPAATGNGTLDAGAPDIFLEELDEVVTSTEGLGANTDYGAGVLVVEEWVVI